MKMKVLVPQAVAETIIFFIVSAGLAQTLLSHGNLEKANENEGFGSPRPSPKPFFFVSAGLAQTPLSHGNLEKANENEGFGSPGQP